MMQRTAINPWEWSFKFGYNQAEIIEGVSRQLICAGQTAADAKGNPQHMNDMRGQIGLALDNLEAVLTKADMNLSDVIRLGVYTTDMDEALRNFDLLGARFGALQCAPPMSLIGVTRLALPSLLFEIEATAAAQHSGERRAFAWASRSRARSFRWNFQRCLTLNAPSTSA